MSAFCPRCGKEIKKGDIYFNIREVFDSLDGLCSKECVIGYLNAILHESMTQHIEIESFVYGDEDW